MELITRKDFKDNIGHSVYVTYVVLNKDSSTFFSGQIKPVKRVILRNPCANYLHFAYNSICNLVGRNDEKVNVFAAYDSNGKMVCWKFFTTKEEAEKYVKDTKERYLEDVRKILMMRKLKHQKAIEEINHKLFKLK